MVCLQIRETSKPAHCCSVQEQSWIIKAWHLLRIYCQLPGSFILSSAGQERARGSSTMERGKDMRIAPDTCFQSLHCLLMSFDVFHAHSLLCVPSLAAHLLPVCGSICRICNGKIQAAVVEFLSAHHSPNLYTSFLTATHRRKGLGRRERR